MIPSLPKLLALGAVIWAVWMGFRLIERRDTDSWALAFGFQPTRLLLQVRLVRTLAKLVESTDGLRGGKPRRDVVGFEDLKKPIHIAFCGFRIFVEINFITARSQGGSWRVFQPFDSLRGLLSDIDKILVEDAQDAILSTVDVLDAAVFHGLLDDAGDACIDRTGWAARLGDEQVAF